MQSPQISTQNVIKVRCFSPPSFDSNSWCCLGLEAEVSDVLSISWHLPLQGSHVPSVMAQLLCRPHLLMALRSVLLLSLMNGNPFYFLSQGACMLRMHHTHAIPCSSQMLSLCLWYPFFCSCLDVEVKDHVLQEAPQNHTTVGYLHLLPHGASLHSLTCLWLPTRPCMASLGNADLIHQGVSGALPRARQCCDLWLMNEWGIQYQGLGIFVGIRVTGFISCDEAQTWFSSKPLWNEAEFESLLHGIVPKTQSQYTKGLT